jgi:spore coat polysaccharide biosynthesis protein SpsF
VRTYPRGLDTEAFSFTALERCWQEASDVSSREHVTAFIYRHPERFKIHGVTHPYDESPHRWTVDTPEDYALACRVYEHFQSNEFHWEEVLALLSVNPEWSHLNAHVEQKAH